MTGYGDALQIFLPLATFLAALGGLAALIMGLYSRRETRRHMAALGGKTEAEGAQVLVSSTIELLQPLRAEVQQAREEAKAARTEAAEARRETAEASRELSRMDVKARALMRALTEAQDENTQLREENARLTDELAQRRRAKGEGTA